MKKTETMARQFPMTTTVAMVTALPLFIGLIAGCGTRFGSHNQPVTWRDASFGGDQRGVAMASPRGSFAAGTSATSSVNAIQSPHDHQQVAPASHTVEEVVPRRVELADAKTFDRQVLDSDIPVMVDFYADWCGPCRALGPVLDELAQETPNAKIVKVNVDDSPELAGQYGVSSIPNLLVFKQGRVVDQQVGLASKQQLKSLLVD